MEICGSCGYEIELHQAKFHLVRMGYCPTMFPFLKYHKIPLCTVCHKKQQRVDKWEKVLALIGLSLVFYLMMHWFVFIFIFLFSN